MAKARSADINGTGRPDRKVKALVLMCLGHMASHWYIGVLMLILPLIKNEFKLTFTEVGLIITFRSLAGALGNTVSGAMVDILGKRHFILAASGGGLAICWTLVGFAPSYLLVLILLPLATLFSNLWHSPAMSVLSEAYPERKGFVLGLHGMAANAGQSLAPLVVGLLVVHWGWRTSVKAQILPGMLTALLVLILLPRLGGFELKRKTMASFFQLFRDKVFKNSSLFMICMISVFRTMGQRGLETFLALFLADQLDLNPIGVGFYLMLLTVTATFPEPLIGWLSDRLGRGAILWISLLLSGLSILAVTMFPPGPALMMAVGALGFFHYSLRPIIFAFALDVTPPEVGATTISYVFTWNQALSAAAPLVGGLLADAFGLQFSLYFIAALCVIAALMAGLLSGRVRPYQEAPAEGGTIGS